MKSVLTILCGLGLLSLTAGCLGLGKGSDANPGPTVADEEAIFIIGGEVEDDASVTGGKYK